jgi:hypothetical protein
LQFLDQITLQPGRRRHIRERLAIRTPELERTVRLTFYLIALLVHGSVVAPTQKREIRERSGPSSSPVLEMMPLTEGHSTARKAATPVPMLQNPAKGGRYRPRPRPDLSDPPLRIVLHDNPRRVTGQALGRFRGNVCAGFQHRLSRLLRV